MSDYLAEAAALLRKASEDNERENKAYRSLLNTRRLEIAQRFAVLAAIEKGLLPAEMATARQTATGNEA